MKKNRTFWFLTVALFLIILLPGMIQQGMFLDGITYSAISKNMANGIGDFWNPHYTNTLYPLFYEHPPLVFGLQSLFFKIFGNGFFTENIYSLFSCFLSSIAILLIWNQMFRKTEFKNWGWIPLLLWIITPIIQWSFKNNLLENTVSVFTLFAVYWQMVSIQKNRSIYLILASISIFLGFLSKGFVALFPLITIWIYLIVYKDFKIKNIYKYAILSSILPFLFFIILYYLVPGFQSNFDYYLSQQLIPAIQNQREVTTQFHTSLLLQLIIQLIFPLLILLFVFVFRYRNKEKAIFENKKWALFFLLIGFSASLPLLITLKQRPFYLVPSIPFFILSFSVLVIPIIKQSIHTLRSNYLLIIKISSYILILTTLFISIMKYGTIKRDHNLIHDIEIISHLVPDNTTIYTQQNVWENWALTAYLSRYHNISLDYKNEQNFLLIAKDKEIKENNKPKYELIKYNLKEYTIYKLINKTP